MENNVFRYGKPADIPILRVIFNLEYDKLLTMNLLKLTALLLLLTNTAFSKSTEEKSLWYKQPAKNWHEEGLPIGNGRMGAMMLGDPQQDRVQFNEQSLWSGDNNWDGGYQTGDRGFGSYRDFGEFVVDFKNIGSTTAYERSLNIMTGIQSTNFESNGVKFSRQAFASYPDQVLVFHYGSNKKGSLSGKISMSSAQGAVSVAKGNQLLISGQMPNKLSYAANLQVQHMGGKVSVEGNTLVFENCDSFIIYLDARTNYKPDYGSNWRGEDPILSIERELKRASEMGYKKLRSRHIEDFSRLLGGAMIDLGQSDKSLKALPTDLRLKKYKGGGEDLDLEEMLFQFGRYLLVSSSRPGGLPANLQGVWNNSNTPPWASDYHNNINIQMNYWAAESTNLSECHEPLIDFIIATQEPNRIATQKAFGKDTRGWTARTSQSIFGGNGWEWNIPASAWYAQHVFEHWAFTRDRDYLEKVAYPILKEICEFWEDRLKVMPDGLLMVPNGWSPEHGPREDGVMHDQQLVWDLFQNYIDVAKELDLKDSYQVKVAGMQSRLAPNKIGSWGQLQEWQADRDNPDDQHRHTSHLFAVFPGRQINMIETPELANAAVISLRSRSGNYGKNKNTPFTVESTVGEGRGSWTWPWRGALWARLGEGDKAGMMVRGLLTFNMTPNLFASIPPFQIDGNLGMSGAIAEMLLQSHTGTVQLLPALPEKWSVKGSFKGLKARGGFTVDCSWENGKVTSYKISSKTPSKVKVLVNGIEKEIISKKMNSKG